MNQIPNIEETQTTKKREDLANAVGADISGYYDADAFIQTYTFNDAQLEALLHRQLQKAREREAYLWFENWYSYYKAPLTGESNQDFGKWATERLQTLGVDHSELNQDKK